MTDKLKELLRRATAFVEAWDDDSQEWMDLKGDIDNELAKPAVEAAEIEVVDVIGYFNPDNLARVKADEISGFMLHDEESERINTAAMTVAQHRRILAGVNQQSGSGVPEGWRFSAADFSCIAAGKNTKGHVSLVRDPESRKAWHSMTDELKEADDGPELYVSGYGYTLADAFAAAANKASAAAPLPPSPAAKAVLNE